MYFNLMSSLLVPYGSVVEHRTAEQAAGDRLPLGAASTYSKSVTVTTGQFGSCPISIWRPDVLRQSPSGI